MTKKRIGVIFGGRSEEHGVSLKSAAFVIEALDSQKFETTCIGITKEGKWKTFSGSADKLLENSWEQYSKDFSSERLKETVDFALPILHGPYGEDGTIQGLLEMENIPYGGCGVLSSAVAMDKYIFKEILKAKGLPICKFLSFTEEEVVEDVEDVIFKIEENLGLPCFVKPANMGSSVGITKVTEKGQIREALRTAFKFDRRIVIEEFIPCRELEVAILEDGEIKTSVVGEILPAKDFYDYQAKYLLRENPSTLEIPASISQEETNRIKDMAKEAFDAIEGSGFGRVDFFKDKVTGKIYINEINTIPGFTCRSMFPLLWQHEGRKPAEIIERIIDSGYERYYAKNYRETTI